MARISALTTIILMAGPLVCAQTAQFTLPQELLRVAQKYHVSLLGELSNPVPRNLNIAMDRVSDPADAIAKIVAAAPDYRWFRRGNVFVVVQKRLFKAPGNPMNQKLDTFTVPENLSRFKLAFPSAVSNTGSHVSGYAIEGFGLPPSLSPLLKKETFRNITVRDVLIKVATQVGNLYSVLILPNAGPSPRRGRLMFLAWDIAGGSGLAKYSVQFESYPTKFAQRARLR